MYYHTISKINEVIISEQFECKFDISIAKSIWHGAKL